MATARLVCMEPNELHLPKPPAGKTYVVYECEGTPQELDGLIRVFPAFVLALGSANIAVAQADYLGRVAAAIGRATAPDSPGGPRITLGEMPEIIVVTVAR